MAVRGLPSTHLATSASWAAFSAAFYTFHRTSRDSREGLVRYQAQVAVEEGPERLLGAFSASVGGRVAGWLLRPSGRVFPTWFDALLFPASRDGGGSTSDASREHSIHLCPQQRVPFLPVVGHALVTLYPGGAQLLRSS